jgi:hypothetical protein
MESSCTATREYNGHVYRCTEAEPSRLHAAGWHYAGYSPPRALWPVDGDCPHSHEFLTAGGMVRAWCAHGELPAHTDHLSRDANGAPSTWTTPAA